MHNIAELGKIPKRFSSFISSETMRFFLIQRRTSSTKVQLRFMKLVELQFRQYFVEAIKSLEVYAFRCMDY